MPNRKRLLLVPLVLLAAGCGPAANEQEAVRPDEAVLSLEEIRRAGSSGLMPGGDLGGATSAEACKGAAEALEQIAHASRGALRYRGNGVLEVPRQLWARAPAEMRGGLIRAVALAGACDTKAAPKDVVVTVQDAGGEVLVRGPFRSLSP